MSHHLPQSSIMWWPAFYLSFLVNHSAVNRVSVSRNIKFYPHPMPLQINAKDLKPCLLRNEDLWVNNQSSCKFVEAKYTTQIHSNCSHSRAVSKVIQHRYLIQYLYIYPGLPGPSYVENGILIGVCSTTVKPRWLPILRPSSPCHFLRVASPTLTLTKTNMFKILRPIYLLTAMTLVMHHNDPWLLTKRYSDETEGPRGMPTLRRTTRQKGSLQLSRSFCPRILSCPSTDS